MLTISSYLPAGLTNPIIIALAIWLMNIISVILKRDQYCLYLVLIDDVGTVGEGFLAVAANPAVKTDNKISGSPYRERVVFTLPLRMPKFIHGVNRGLLKEKFTKLCATARINSHNIRLRLSHRHRSDATLVSSKCHQYEIKFIRLCHTGEVRASWWR